MVRIYRFRLDPAAQRNICNEKKTIWPGPTIGSDRTQGRGHETETQATAAGSRARESETPSPSRATAAATR
jgi:hypothetical protein